jgi:hypothetical protein
MCKGGADFSLDGHTSILINNNKQFVGTSQSSYFHKEPGGITFGSTQNTSGHYHQNRTQNGNRNRRHLRGHKWYRGGSERFEGGHKLYKGGSEGFQGGHKWYRGCKHANLQRRGANDLHEEHRCGVRSSWDPHLNLHRLAGYFSPP